jgi:hypothetical protein
MKQLSAQRRVAGELHVKHKRPRDSTRLASISTFVMRAYGQSLALRFRIRPGPRPGTERGCSRTYARRQSSRSPDSATGRVILKARKSPGWLLENRNIRVFEEIDVTSSPMPLSAGDALHRHWRGRDEIFVSCTVSRVQFTGNLLPLRCESTVKICAQMPETSGT